MLKLTPLAFFIGFSLTLFSQSQEIVKAKMAYEDRDYAKAKLHIDKGSANEKTAKKAKTWMLRGDIYHQLMFSSDPDIQSLSKDAGTIAFEAYQKALSIDSKIGRRQIEGKCSMINNGALNKGVLFYNEKDYQQAKNSFELAVDISEWLGEMDTLALFNRGLACNGLKDYRCAIETYTRCIELNYRTESCYESLGLCYQLTGNPDKAREVVLRGAELYPQNNTLQTSLLNIHLQSGEAEKALNLINKLIEESPNYAPYYSVKGSILSGLNHSDDAIATLEKGLELDPESFDMSFNIGSIYFNKAVDIMIAANNESDFEKSEELTKKAMVEFEVTRKHLENAHALRPDERGTMEALKNVYTYTGNQEKLEAMIKKLRQ